MQVLDYTFEIILLAWIGYGVLLLYKKYVMVDTRADVKLDIMAKYCKLVQRKNK